jgi:DNA-binding CsgD family transcriptional regulator
MSVGTRLVARRSLSDRQYCGRVAATSLPDVWPLVGREEELSLLDREVAERSGSVVIAGAAGVGKSRLVARWLEGGTARGRPTIAVRATRSTATIPFGAFAPWVPSQAGDAGDRLVMLQATVARVIDGGTPVVTVDDGHLLDEGSAALLLHLAQHTPAGVVVTVRSGEPCPDAVLALWKEGAGQRLDLQALSEVETAELLARVLGDTLSPAARRRIWGLTAGNPLYLREVVHAALDQGVLALSAGVWHWKGDLAGSPRLVELIGDRIGRQSNADRHVLEIVALGEPLPLDVLERIVPGGVLADVESRNLLVVDQQPSGPGARLAHPIYSEVIRGRLPTLAAQRHHRSLAKAAMAAGWHERDTLRVALWLLDGGDDLAEPAVLLDAAAQAFAIEEFELAARLAEGAERAGGGWRATYRRAEALSPLHRWDEVDALLAGLSGDGASSEVRSWVANLRSHQLFYHRLEVDPARGVIAEALPVGRPQERARLAASGAFFALVALDLEETIDLAAVAASGGSDPEARAWRVHGVAMAGCAAALQGRTSAAQALVELSLPYVLEVVDAEPLPVGVTVWSYSLATRLDGRLDAPTTLFEMLLGQDFMQRSGGHNPYRGVALMLYARVVLDQGDLGTAQRLAAEALELIGRGSYRWRAALCASTLATAAAQRGDASLAAETLTGVGQDAPPEMRLVALQVELARAWLSAARGELSHARAIALTTAEQARGAGAWAIEMVALLDAVRLGAAREAFDGLTRLAGTIEGPYVAAAAAFARALETRDGDRLDAVSGRFEEMGARLVAAEAAAQAVGAHGAEGLRRRRAASLARAQTLVASCQGASTPFLADLDRQPVAAALTARERETVELAARGLTNREIAGTLYVSLRTVNSHLNHAYTKLGTSDRDKLAGLLGLAPRSAPEGRNP